jgi:hypothetical protein
MPITAIRSVPVLRHLVAGFGPGMSSVGKLQWLMHLTVFISEAKEMLHHNEVFKESANFLLELTLLRASHVLKDLLAASELLSVMDMSTHIGVR